MDCGFPSNTSIRREIAKGNADIKNVDRVVVLNIFEFKTKKDYLEFEEID